MKIINFIKNNYKAIFVAVFFIIIMLLLRQCDSTRKWKNQVKAERQKANQNLIALSDSIENYKNKNNKQTYAKVMAEMSPKELKINFPELYQKVKSEIGEVKYVTNTKIIYKDTGSIKNSVAVLSENYYGLHSNYFNKDSTINLNSISKFYAIVQFLNEDHSKFKLKITPDVTTYEEMSFKFGLTTGVKKDKDGLYKIFVTPDNDKFVITDIKGADVSDLFKDNKNNIKGKRKWSIGPNLGYSIVFGKNNQIYHGVSAGISIQYSLLRF